jgi:hypothetical protein
LAVSFVATHSLWKEWGDPHNTQKSFSVRSVICVFPSCLVDDYNVQQIMLTSISCTEKRLKKRPGRGRPRKNPTSIHLTLVPALLGAVDKWTTEQEEALSRAEAVRRLIGTHPEIRRLVEQALSTGKKR